MLSIFGFILTISLLVFIHEFGHYYVARLFGIKVEEFSIGFGKELFSRISKAGEKWKICMLPFGGYVKIYGFNQKDSDGPIISEPNKAFYSKPLYAQFLVVAAGPIANYLLAILLFSVMYLVYGKSEVPAVVGEIAIDSPAYISGLKKDDTIIMLGNQKIDNMSDVQRIMLGNEGEAINLLVRRETENVNITITPKLRPQTNNQKSSSQNYYIGIAAKDNPIRLKMSIFESVYQGIKDSLYISNIILKTIGQMITGSRSLDELSGPITIAKASAQTLQQGIASYTLFIAMISINLGLFNLLPIPVLDGGHLVFIIYEAIFGKTLSGRVKNVILRLGILLIIFLIVISVSNDIKSVVF